MAAASVSLSRAALMGPQGTSALISSRPRLTTCHPGTDSLRQGVVDTKDGRRAASRAKSSRPGRTSQLQVATAAAASNELPVAPVPEEPLWDTHVWTWKNGWQIRYATAGEGRPIVLVHGFGASLGQYRKNIPALAAAGYKVYALDLLGFGGSSKPATLEFNMQIWCDQLVDFFHEVVRDGSEDGPGAVFVGNSIGSLAALMANRALPEGSVAGTVLLNCAAGMNNKAVLGDWRVNLAKPIFALIDLILKSKYGRSIFDNVRQPETLRGALTSLYSSAESVDDELVKSFYDPSCDDGAAEVFVNIYTGADCGPGPLEVIPDTKGPILILWGDEDNLTPRDGPIGRAFEALADTRPETVFVPLPDCGHCLHDDRPDLVHAKLLPWLAQLP